MRKLLFVLFLVVFFIPAAFGNEGRWVVSTLTGGEPLEEYEEFPDGPGLEARFAMPIDLAVDAAGNLYVADCNNHRIRLLRIE